MNLCRDDGVFEIGPSFPITSSLVEKRVKVNEKDLNSR